MARVILYILFFILNFSDIDYIYIKNIMPVPEYQLRASRLYAKNNRAKINEKRNWPHKDKKIKRWQGLNPVSVRS